MDTLIIVLIGVVFIGLGWLLYILRSGRDFETSLRTRCHRAWRRIVFLVGDIRKLDSFPYVTWDVHEHEVEYDEAMEALCYVKAGDVGVHRDKGYLSNCAIPGFMKHAWVHVTDPVKLQSLNDREHYDTTKTEIVEAISEGVVRRHALYPIRSDYVIILRPKDANANDIVKAVKKANKIVGCEYDADFKFDIEEELARFKDTTGNIDKLAEEKNEFTRTVTNIKAEWDGGFSCTETASFCWWHLRDKLRLYRIEARGKKVILADQFINGGFDIIWMSKSVTPEVARKLGLGEEGILMITEYIKNYSKK
jgi:hypothetical protein